MKDIKLLSMSAQDIELLIVKSKYAGDNQAEFKLHKLIYLRCCNAQIKNENIRTIVTIIIASILLEHPLATQQKHIKSLYKRFGTQANKSKMNVAKMKQDLNAVEQRGEGNYHVKSALVERIVEEERLLDNYAQEQAQISNHCPRCVTHYGAAVNTACEICDNTGKIAVTMEDAKAFFDKLDLLYNPSDFLSEYWNKMLLIVNELKIK